MNWLKVHSTKSLKTQCIIPKQLIRLVFTYGKLYYDLHKRMAEEGVTNMAIVRVEQLFPLPIEQIKSIIAKYTEARKRLLGARRTIEYGCMVAYTAFFARRAFYTHFAFS